VMTLAPPRIVPGSSLGGGSKVSPLGGRVVTIGGISSTELFRTCWCERGVWGLGGGSFGVGTQKIVGGGRLMICGKSIFALITTATTATWAAMIASIVLGWGRRSTGAGRLAA